MSSDVRAASSSEGRPPRIVGPAPGDWFFYGSLKPSQPGWDQIIDLIEARVDADAVGWTVTRRDGLPLLEQWDEQEDAVAPGIVVRAKAGCEDELKTRLKRIENDSVYRVTNVRVRVKPGEGQLEGVEYARAWVAKDHGRDRGLPLPQGWGLEHDELFARGFPVLFDYLKPCIERITCGERNDHDYWTSFIFPLEGGFLVLCSMLERLAIVRDKAPGKTTDRIEALDSHPAATHAAITARPPQVTVFVANSREDGVGVVGGANRVARRRVVRALPGLVHRAIQPGASGQRAAPEEHRPDHEICRRRVRYSGNPPDENGPVPLRRVAAVRVRLPG